MIPITAVVLTKNEESQLADCLASLAWADEILIIDSYSVDGTLEIAKRAGARVVQHPFVNFAEQRNVSHTYASNDWLFHLDADERVTPALAAEIKELASAGRLADHSGYYFARLDLWLGFWFPETPDHYVLTKSVRNHLIRNRFIRLYDRKAGQWERPLHEVVKLKGSIGFLQGAIVHYSATNLSRMLESVNSYTDLEAAYLLHNDERSGVHVAIWRGFRTAAYLYFAWRLYRYGAPGMIFAIHQGYTKYMNYIKLWELQRIAGNLGVWTDIDRALLNRARERTQRQEDTITK